MFQLRMESVWGVDVESNMVHLARLDSHRLAHEFPVISRFLSLKIVDPHNHRAVFQWFSEVRCTGVSVLTTGVVSAYPSCLGNCSNLCQPLDTVVTEPRRINGRPGRPGWAVYRRLMNASPTPGIHHEPRRRECSQTCLQ